MMFLVSNSNHIMFLTYVCTVFVALLKLNVKLFCMPTEFLDNDVAFGLFILLLLLSSTFC